MKEWTVNLNHSENSLQKRYNKTQIEPKYCIDIFSHAYHGLDMAWWETQYSPILLPLLLRTVI